MFAGIGPSPSTLRITKETFKRKRLTNAVGSDKIDQWERTTRTKEKKMLNHLNPVQIHDNNGARNEFRFPVMGDTGTTYVITQLDYHGNNFACTCPDYFYRGHNCKHIQRWISAGPDK